jgi:hypothetical protein
VKSQCFWWWTYFLMPIFSIFSNLISMFSGNTHFFRIKPPFYHFWLKPWYMLYSGKTTTFHPKTTIFHGEDLPRSMGRRAPGLRSLPSGHWRRPLWRSTLQTAVQGQGAPGVDPGDLVGLNGNHQPKYPAW